MTFRPKKIPKIVVLLVVNNVKKNKYFLIFLKKVLPLVQCTWRILGSAPVHHAQMALGFLREQGVEFWSPQNVPPNSQAFSLCDCDIWSYIEGMVCKTTVPAVWHSSDAISGQSGAQLQLIKSASYSVILNSIFRNPLKQKARKAKNEINLSMFDL